MSGWNLMKISEVSDLNPESVASDFPFDEIEYIDISSVGTGIFNSGPRLINLSEAPSRAKRIVRDNDIILSTVRPNRRSFVFIKKSKENSVASTGFAVLRPTGIDSKFLYYVISTQRFTDYLVSNAKGSAYPAVDIDTIGKAEILLPKENAQKRISSIISTYDELIENNQKRIEILEEMAQRFYTEWFVNFKFPGHEDVELVDSGTEFGEIPEGWEVRELQDLVEIKKGKNITRKTVKEGYVPVVAGGLEPAYFHNMANTKAPVITVSASGANAGYVNIYYQEIWASDCSYIDQNSTKSIYYFYLVLKNKQNEINNLQKGSAQPHVYPKDLQKLKTVSASSEILEAFHKIVSNYYEEVKLLKKQNETCSGLRDLLIENLITGKRLLKQNGKTN